MQNQPEQKPFDQIEDIKSRLRSLVRNYPKGLGLIKEFLQNADDAGASYLKVIFDKRTHQGPINTDSPEMDVALLPSLLFINDEVFSEADFNRIQQIGEGGKVHDAARTGRFGQGFNTCYSVSDHPSLLTGNDIAWFDPHHYTIQDGRNAHAWGLRSVKECWPNWLNTFVDAGYSFDEPSYKGTIFRLPLRTKENAHESKIIADEFTDNDFESILDELNKIGPAILVFLRSVLELEIIEISEDGEHTKRIHIKTINTQEVNNKRNEIITFVQGEPKDFLNEWMSENVDLPVIHYQQNFSILQSDGAYANDIWNVTSGIFRGQDNELILAALDVCNQNEKAIPWASVASQNQNEDYEGEQGGIACFLPIPETNALPIWINGYFDLLDNRKGITRTQDVGETTQIRFRWNKLLMEHGVGKVWAQHVFNIRGEASNNPEPYHYWPNIPDNSDEVDNALYKGFYQSIVDYPVFRVITKTSYEWTLICDDLIDDCPCEIIEPFVAQGWKVCSPDLSSGAFSGLLKHTSYRPLISIEKIRQNISEFSLDLQAFKPINALQPMLSKKSWVIALAKYCAEGNWDNLEGLPLAICADGHIRTFGHNEIFLTKELDRLLLKSIPEQQLDKKYRKSLEIEEPSIRSKVSLFDLEKFLEVIPSVLEQKPTDITFISLIFDFLLNQSEELIQEFKKELKELRIIPSQKGVLFSMGKNITPLKIETKISKELFNLLTSLGISLLNTTPDLENKIVTFSNRNSGFLWRLTPEDLVDSLSEVFNENNVGFNILNVKTNQVLLLDFLCSSDLSKYDKNQLGALKSFTIFPTSCGELVSADDENIYCPGGFRAPQKLKKHHRLLELGKNNVWENLYNVLGIEKLDINKFISDIYITAFKDAKQSEVKSLLLWLRDEYLPCEADLDFSVRKANKELLIKSLILPVNGGGLASPKSVYHPDYENEITILGFQGNKLDINLFKDINSWEYFLNFLSLPKEALASDIYNEVQCLSELSTVDGFKKRIKHLKALSEYINKHWDKLKDQPTHEGGVFSQELAELAWLPAVTPEQSKFAGCKDWGDKLWQGRELMVMYKGHLYASVRPILSFNLSPVVQESLGVRANDDIEDIAKHFDFLKLVDNKLIKNNEQIDKAVNEFYKFIGRTDVHFSYIDSINSNSIFIKNRWTEPRYCFMEKLPMHFSSISSIKDSNIEYKNSNILDGIKKLGVRDTLKNDDWKNLLENIYLKCETKILSKNDTNQARYAIRQLRASDKDWLFQNDIFVLLTSGLLINAEGAFIPDDPRLKNTNLLSDIPILEDNEDVLDVGSRAGAKSLKNSIIDRLKASPIQNSNRDSKDIIEKLIKNIRSSTFEECLARLVSNETISQINAKNEAIVLSKFGILKSLNIKLSKEIVVESSIDIDGDIKIVFESSRTHFFDRNTLTIWIKVDTHRNLTKRLVHFLSEQFSLPDQLTLNDLICTEPSSMHKLLDDEGIIDITKGKIHNLDDQFYDEDVELIINQENLSDDEIEIQEEVGSNLEQPDYFSPSEVNPHPYEGKTEPQKIILDAEYNKHVSENVDNTKIDSNPNPSSLNNTKPEREIANNSNGKKNHRDIDPRPINKINARVEKNSQSENENIVNSSQRNNTTNKNRNTSNNIPKKENTNSKYNAHAGLGMSINDCDKGTVEAKRIGDAGEIIAKLFEDARGWSADLMEENNTGFDLVSQRNSEIRYIEVKSINGSWGSRGVGVSRAQFETALAEGDNWWLYVVEHALDESKSIVHTFQNPFLYLDEYRFDRSMLDN